MHYAVKFEFIEALKLLVKHGNDTQVHSIYEQ